MKDIPLAQINGLFSLIKPLNDTYWLRETLIQQVKEIKGDGEQDPSDSYVRKVCRDTASLMGEPAVSPDLPADEIIALAECRIKKANDQIQKYITQLYANYQISIEDKR